MRRRGVIAGIFGVAAAWPARGQARQRVAFLSLAFATRDSTPVQLMLDRMRELGDIEGRDFDLTFEVADDLSQIDARAAAVMAAQPDIIVVLNVSALDPMRKLTRSIPIVVVYSGDPIGLGYSTSWSRPSENVTGIMADLDTLADKRVELLHEILPSVRRFGIVYEPSSRIGRYVVELAQAATRARGLELQVYPVLYARDLDAVPARAAADGVGAIIVVASPNIIDNHIAFIAAATAHRIATMHAARFEALDGGLVAYGRDTVENWVRAGDFVHRLLHGAKVSDLPFEQSVHVPLTLNLVTARAIGVEVPPLILARADEVIE